MHMKKAISKAICIKNISICTVISSCCILAIGTFIKLFFESLSTGEEIFIPGVLALGLAILVILVFSVTRVIKQIYIFRQID